MLLQTVMMILILLPMQSGFDNFEIGVDFAVMLVSNPRNPLNMQFGVNSSVTGQNAYYTTNGHDWTQSNPSYNPSICCDPWSAFDSLGTLFYGSGVSGQYVYKSTNGGQNYGAGVLSVNGNDRNTLAADQTNWSQELLVCCYYWKFCKKHKQWRYLDADLHIQQYYTGNNDSSWS